MTSGDEPDKADLALIMDATTDRPATAGPTLSKAGTVTTFSPLSPPARLPIFARWQRPSG